MFPFTDIRMLFASVAGCIAGIALAVLVYEGIPLGPFEAIKRIPLIGPAIETLTDGRVDRERKAALAGYVKQVELTAAQKELDVLNKRLAASRKATDGYMDLLRTSRAESQAQDEQDRIKDQAYEKRLADLGRRCPLDRDDIDYIMR